MKTSSATQTRVVVAGPGVVGATYCHALAQGDLADVVAVVDKRENLIQRQVLDLVYRQPIHPIMPIHLGNPSEHADSQSIVLRVGVIQCSRETRPQRLHKNEAVVRSIGGVKPARGVQ